MAAVQRVKRCPGCHHTKFIQDMLALLGDLSCENCGMVQEENPIISEVQFGESSTGAAMVQGAMVGADQVRANFSMRNAMELREQTLLSAKLKIKKLGSAMKIPEYILESASGWFKLALVQNFVQGRRSQNVIAACLYVACRHEKTHHLLIDFSSRLQISVFSLGATYLKLVRALQIQKLPLADPSLFIQHFAERLDFGDQTAKICRDATKLALTMAKDWIYEGRRPAGIAGACLMLAARMNDQRRSHGEIVAIARVGQETIQKRLSEFSKTQSGAMTLSQFRESEGTASSLPPSFTQNRRIELRILSILSQRSRVVKQYKKLASRNKLFDVLFEQETDKRPVPKLESNSDIAAQKSEESDKENTRQGTPKDSEEAAATNENNEEAGESEVYEDANETKDKSQEDNAEGEANASAEANDKNDGENNETANGNEDDEDDEDDEIFDLLPDDDPPPQPKEDQPYKPTTKRLSGLRTDFGLRNRLLRPTYDDNSFEKEYDALPAKHASRRRRSTTASVVKKDGLLRSVLAGGDLTEKDVETALEMIWKNQQKTLQQSLYQIPLESEARSLFVPEEEGPEFSPTPEEVDRDEERLARQIELNRPRNLLKNLPTTDSLLSKVSDDPNLGDDEDDDEVDFMLLTKEMSEDKEKIWTSLNYEFLIAQEKRVLKQAADEIAGNTSGQQRKRRRIKDTSMDPVLNDAAVANAISLIGEDGKTSTPADSAKQMLQGKAFSKKINYDSIGSLFRSAAAAESSVLPKPSV